MSAQLQPRPSWQPDPLRQIDCEADAERERRRHQCEMNTQELLNDLRAKIAAQETRLAELQLTVEAYRALAPWLIIEPATARTIIRLAQEELAWAEHDATTLKRWELLPGALERLVPGNGIDTPDEYEPIEAEEPDLGEGWDAVDAAMPLSTPETA